MDIEGNRHLAFRRKSYQHCEQPVFVSDARIARRVTFRRGMECTQQHRQFIEVRAEQLAIDHRRASSRIVLLYQEKYATKNGSHRKSLPTFTHIVRSGRSVV